MDKSAKTGVTPFWVVLGSEKLNTSENLGHTLDTRSLQTCQTVSAWEYIPLSKWLVRGGPKIGVPQIIHFHRFFHCKPSIIGVPPL